MRILFAGKCGNHPDEPQSMETSEKVCPDRHSFECLSGQCLRNPPPRGRGSLLWQARRHGSVTMPTLSSQCRVKSRQKRHFFLERNS